MCGWVGRPALGRRQTLQAVQAGGVPLGPVLAYAFAAFPGRPLVHSRPVLLECHFRHAVPAGIRHAAHLDDDDRAHAHSVTAGEPLNERGKLRLVGKYRPTGAMQANDAGRPCEGTEHHDDPAVLPEVSDGLHTAARLVKIGHLALTQDGELVPVALGGAIHQAVPVQWGGGDEEHRLGGDPLRHACVYVVIRFGHTSSISSEAIPAHSSADLPVASILVTLAAKVLTVSDSVSRGERPDRSGEAVAEALRAHGFDVVERRVVTDGTTPVAEALTALSDRFGGLVVTTGGTGFSPTDLTPEATRQVLDREAPGLAEAMRAVSPLGPLSRGIAGTVGQCLVLNLPGSPKGAIESLEAVLDVLGHALELLLGGRPH